MKAREERERLRGPDAPARFLVLDVSRADIVPFLFVNRQTAQQEKGRLERLPGKNPFNKRESFEEPMPLRREYGYPSQHASTAGPINLPYQAPREAQYQEAVTTERQWYSGDKGSEKLQKVFEDIKEIAVGDVDMSRDKITQDISLSFIDKRRRTKWEIRFPQTFPTVGALLIKNPGTSQEKQQRQGTSDRAGKAVKNMISCIENTSFMY